MTGISENRQLPLTVHFVFSISLCLPSWWQYCLRGKYKVVLPEKAEKALAMSRFRYFYAHGQHALESKEIEIFIQRFRLQFY